jgi:hypothetical protein
VFKEEKEMISEGALVVGTRDKDEWREGHENVDRR